MLPPVDLDMAPITRLFTLPAAQRALDRLLDGFFIHLTNGGNGPFVLGIVYVAAIPCIAPEAVGHGREALFNGTLEMLAAIPAECGLTSEAAQHPCVFKSMLRSHAVHVAGPCG